MNPMRLLRFAPTLAILGAMVYAGQAVNEILASRPAPPAENPAAVLAKLGLDALAGEPKADVLGIRRLRDRFNLDAGSAAPAGVKAAQEDRLADLVDQAVLSATIIQGETRLAVVNGKLYKQGETLAAPVRGAPPLVVKAVKHHEVELAAGGRSFTLSYADRLSRGKGGGRRAGVARRGPSPGVGPAAGPNPQLPVIRSLLDSELDAVGSSLVGAVGIQAHPGRNATRP